MDLSLACTVQVTSGKVYESFGIHKRNILKLGFPMKNDAKCEDRYSLKFEILSQNRAKYNDVVYFAKKNC